MDGTNEINGDCAYEDDEEDADEDVGNACRDPGDSCKIVGDAHSEADGKHIIF